MASKASHTHLDSVARPLSALRVRITLIVEFKMEDLSVAADIAGAVKGALEKLEEIGEGFQALKKDCFCLRPMLAC